MRLGYILLTSIVLFVATPVFADNLSDNEADISRRKADIQQQEQRIKNLLSLLNNDKTVPTPEIVAKPPLIKPEDTGLSTTTRSQQGPARDNFDLTNLSVVCFSREGRPVCSRTGYQQ